MASSADFLLDEKWWAGQTMPDGPHAGKVWWGWGLVSDMQAEIAKRLASHKGEPVLRPPSLQDWKLPPPRVAPEALTWTLRRLCSASTAERLFHSAGRDTTDVLRNVRGYLPRVHDFVAYPETEEDVLQLLQECSRLRIAVVPFGGGSSVVWGVAPPALDGHFRGSIALDLAKLDRLLEVDAASQCARIQGGMYGPALEAALKEHGLTLRHYPQSFEFSTVGGWIVTRGGGHFATGPTHIDELTQAVRLATPAGVTESRRLPGSGAGPAEHRLYLGSEGALGVVTEAWLRLRPRPRVRSSATVLFSGSDADDAFVKGAKAVQAMAQTGLQPANLRLVYGPEVSLMSDFPAEQKKALESGAVLLLGLESPVPGDKSARAVQAQTDLLLDLATNQCGGLVIAQKSALGASSQRGERDGIAGAWGTGFMKGGYTSSASCLFPKMLVNTFETACTWEAFPTMHAATLRATRETARRLCGEDASVSVTCRFTHIYPDGPAPYYTVVLRGLPQRFAAAAAGGDDPRVALWLEIKHAAMDALIAAGGTSTHHHAVGRLHQPHYERERGALFGRALAAVKAAYDPAGVLNPGILVSAPSSKL